MTGGGVFRAGSRRPEDLAAQVLLALDTPSFEFPTECLASHAVPRIVEVYESTG
jgi:hypothetical protein